MQNITERRCKGLLPSGMQGSVTVLGFHLRLEFGVALHRAEVLTSMRKLALGPVGAHACGTPFLAQLRLHTRQRMHTVSYDNCPQRTQKCTLCTIQRQEQLCSQALLLHASACIGACMQR